ncbi:MAG: DMT family transporter [Pseudomonadota bacterium]
MPQLGPAALMFAAGIGIPILAALNAALGQRLGSSASAALILFAVAFLSAGITTAVTRGAFTQIAGTPIHLYTAGILVAFYVLSITWVAPTFGVGNAVFFVLIGQLVSAALIDHFGLFGARMLPITPMRALGITVMAAGVFLTQIAGRGA